jgi:hypothetical protein
MTFELILAMTWLISLFAGAYQYWRARANVGEAITACIASVALIWLVAVTIFMTWGLLKHAKESLI